MNNDTHRSKLDCFLRAVYPVIVYMLAEEIILTLLELLTEQMRRGNSPFAILCTEYAGNVHAIEMAFSMLAGLLIVFCLFHPDGHLVTQRPVPFEEDGHPVTQRPVPREKTGQRTAALTAAVIGAAAAGFSLNVLFSLSGIVKADAAAADASSGLYAVGLLPGIVIYGLIAPYAEELLFRGILLKRLRSSFTAGEAVLMSAILFGIYHGNLSQGLYGTAMGLLFGCGFVLTRELAVPAAMHALTNIVVFALGETGVYGEVCTVPWLVSSAGIAAMLLYFAYTILRKKEKQDE